MGFVSDCEEKVLRKGASIFWKLRTAKQFDIQHAVLAEQRMWYVAKSRGCNSTTSFLQTDSIASMYCKTRTRLRREEKVCILGGVFTSKSRVNTVKHTLPPQSTSLIVSTKGTRSLSAAYTKGSKTTDRAFMNFSSGTTHEFRLFKIKDTAKQ